MNIVETEFWCLMLPPEWIAEQEEDVIYIYDEDEIGELTITTLIREESADASSEPEELARSESPEVGEWQPVQLGAFSGVTGGFEEDEASVREWYVSFGHALLYLTYICDRGDVGMDDAAVDEILDTLVPGDALAQH